MGASAEDGSADIGGLSARYAPRPSDSCFHRAETREVHPLGPQQNQADTLITECTSRRSTTSFRRRRWIVVPWPSASSTAEQSAGRRRYGPRTRPDTPVLPVRTYLTAALAGETSGTRGQSWCPGRGAGRAWR